VRNTNPERNRIEFALWSLVDGEKFRVLARETHLSRKTVKKCLTQDVGPVYRRRLEP
jgi:hypothetical protein